MNSTTETVRRTAADVIRPTWQRVMRLGDTVCRNGRLGHLKLSVFAMDHIDQPVVTAGLHSINETYVVALDPGCVSVRMQRHGSTIRGDEFHTTVTGYMSTEQATELHAQLGRALGQNRAV